MLIYSFLPQVSWPSSQTISLTRTLIYSFYYSIYIHTLHMTEPSQETYLPPHFNPFLYTTRFSYVYVPYPIHSSNTHDTPQTTHFHSSDSRYVSLIHVNRFTTI